MCVLSQAKCSLVDIVESALKAKEFPGTLVKELYHLVRVSDPNAKVIHMWSECCRVLFSAGISDLLKAKQILDNCFIFSGSVFTVREVLGSAVNVREPQLS